MTVLIHQNTNIVERRGQSAYGGGTGLSAEGSTRQNRISWSGGDVGGSRDGDTFCSVCHQRGHLRADCYSLKSNKYKFGSGMQAKGAGLAVPRWQYKPNVVPTDSQVKCFFTADLESYAPFVRMGYVSMVGSDV